MSTWLTESEFRQSGAAATGVTLNVAFLQEIKDDNVQFKQVLNETVDLVRQQPRVNPKEMVDSLIRFQDELETHFALEEFYGYFQNAPITNPSISPQANEIQNEHKLLFVHLQKTVELAEQVLYKECSDDFGLDDVAMEFEEFLGCFRIHEQSEMELMMRLCNEEIGVGD